MIVKIKNKEVKIPDEEIQKNMKILELTEEEAIQMWLEDEGYEVNEEVEKLTKKAKENKTNVRGEAEKPRAKRVVERKANPVKEEIIMLIANVLKDYGNLPISDIKVENVGKIVTFKVENREFKVDLVEKRGKNGEKSPFF